MTDGAANEPLGTTPNPCQYALNAATAAKNAGVQLITIGFGIENKADTGNQCHDGSGTYRNISGGNGPWVGPLLQAMASGAPASPSAARKCSTSRAATVPLPAAVTAWR